MKRLNLNFLLILLLILSYSNLSFPQVSSSSFESDLDSLLSSDFFSKSQIAIDIFDLTNNKLLYSKNEKLLMRPASVEKILTTATALKFLGTDYKFKTGFYHTGSIEDSVCKGDLYIVGGFDPCFSYNDLDSVIGEIKNYGINEIRGNCYADVSAGDSLFWGNGWMWDDDPGAFAAYLSPLNIEKNQVKIICLPDTAGGSAIVKMYPANNFLPVENYSITSDTGQTNLTITRDWLNRSNKIIVKGNINLIDHPDTFSVNIYNPTKYFLDLLSESLTKHGVVFRGRTDTLTLHGNYDKIFSLERNVDSVIVYTNKNTYNLGAEMLLRATATEYFPKSISAEEGITLVDSLISLCGFNPSNFKIADGSGLSFYNLLTAELVTSILKYIYFNEEKLFVALYNSFPIAGYDGTLKTRMRESNVEKRVRAKTGTLSGVSNLAGYIRSRNGNLLTFTIFIQNYTGSADYARSVQDKICELMFEYL